MNLLIYLGGGAGAMLALGALARGAWRFNRLIVQIAAAVVELVPNGGGSIKDTVHRTEQKVDDTTQKVEDNARELRELAERFDAHLAEHTTTLNEIAKR
ncbi:hypothetical protein [Streptomyces cavernae]|uniref:hypothetical protein n=1 Tax=Streptomyces cavernae TaxID=2259034 RepID=UPI000FEC03CC|nr:hypothetical protein [Streptomyces cavernae]